MKVRFSLNGETVEVDAAPTTTLLDWLRIERGLTGTKEGCNEGDCGACSVMVTDGAAPRALNACILFLPQLNGKAVRTVEGIAGPDGTLHPVQDAMITHHGSQCGFCTPGFVVSMATAHAAGRTDHDDVLAGNLCRCTGYAPIVRAAEAAEDADVPAWMADSAVDPAPAGAPPEAAEPGPEATPSDWGAGAFGAGTGAARLSVPGIGAVDGWQPTDLDAFAAYYADHPEATLIAGATDVGLWVTKGLRDLGTVVFLNELDALRGMSEADGVLRVGAMTTMAELLPVLRRHHPSYAEMIRRYGADQVRQAATIGGNIANGSPIGDNPPALIALNATLHLRRGGSRRDVSLEDFFLDYGKQDRQPGEFVEAVSFPTEAPALRVYKLSKRFDQDISAVCGAFHVTVTDGVVSDARIAFGGMAGIPKRATGAEGALAGQAWTSETVERAAEAMTDDFESLSDMRASAEYRMEAAQNMLRRYFRDLSGQTVDVLGVAP